MGTTERVLAGSHGPGPRLSGIRGSRLHARHILPFGEAFRRPVGRFGPLNFANDPEWLKRRFYRLCLPFALWSVLAFATWRMLGPHFPTFATDPSDGAFWKEGCAVAPEPVAFKYLVLQALGTTRTLGSQMWFQAVLVVLTGFFAIFFRVARPRHVLSGLAILFAIGVMMDYSGLNFALFDHYRYEVRNPLGRIFPMLPYAAIGLAAGMHSRRLDGLDLPRRWLVVALGVVAVAFLMR